MDRFKYQGAVETLGAGKLMMVPDCNKRGEFLKIARAILMRCFAFQKA